MAARLLCVMLALILVGCTDSGPPSDRDGGLRVYRHSMDGAPTSLDPVQAATVYAGVIVNNLYDTLYSYKYLARPYQLEPNLAEGMPEISPDGLVYTIRLKRGVHFIDDAAFEGGRGREVVAADVAYSLKRHFDPAMRPQGAWLWHGKIAGLEEWKAAGSDYDRPVVGLKLLDRYTLQIRLLRPFPQLVYTLSQAYAAVVPREAVERYGREFSLHPVGSGPFRLVSFDTARAVLEPNPDYRWVPVNLAAEGYDPQREAYSGLEAIDGRTPPFVDRLEIAFITDSAARWNSFTKGNEIQYAGVPVELVDHVLVSKDPVRLAPEYAQKYRVSSDVEAGFVYQSFNMDFPEIGYNADPERNRRNHALRCALIKAFDWKARNESFYFGLGIIFPGVIPPVLPEFDPAMSRDSVTRDVEGARRLLAENGWTAENLPTIVYGTTGGVRTRQFYEQLRAWFKQIGYPPEKIVLKQFATFGDLNRQWRESRLPYIGLGWLLDYPDAENTLQLFYGPNAAPGSNLANYRNPDYDALYEQAAVMSPSPARTAIYRRMNRMIVDDCVTIAGLSRRRIAAWHRDVIMFPDTNMARSALFRYVALSDGHGGIREAGH